MPSMMLATSLAAVADRLQQLVDGAQLDQLLDVGLVAEQLRHRAAQHPVGVGLEPVDLLAALEDRIGALDVGEQADRGLHPLAAHLVDLGELLRFGGGAAQIVERDRFRDILDEIQDVIHGGDQLVDLVAVEGRDEGLVQQRDALVGQLVGGALDGVDALCVRLELGEGAEHRGELAAALDDALRMRVEQVEELPLAGHQASEHRATPSFRGRAILSLLLRPDQNPIPAAPARRRRRAPAARAAPPPACARSAAPGRAAPLLPG